MAVNEEKIEDVIAEMRRWPAVTNSPDSANLWGRRLDPIVGYRYADRLTAALERERQEQFANAMDSIESKRLAVLKVAEEIEATRARYGSKTTMPMWAEELRRIAEGK